MSIINGLSSSVIVINTRTRTSTISIILDNKSLEELHSKFNGLIKQELWHVPLNGGLTLHEL